MCAYNKCGCQLQGRALSRAKSRRNLDFQDVLDKLADMGIAIRVASPKLVMEEVSGRMAVQFLYMHFMPYMCSDVPKSLCLMQMTFWKDLDEICLTMK